MKQTKCSLCEGRIVDGRCQECGMYYRQIQGRYYLNENRNNSETDRRDKYSEKTKEYSPKASAGTIIYFIIVLLIAGVTLLNRI